MREFVNIPNFMSMSKMLFQLKQTTVIYYYIYVVEGIDKMFCLSLQTNLIRLNLSL